MAFDIKGTVDVGTDEAIASLEQMNSSGFEVESTLNEIDGKLIDVDVDEGAASLDGLNESTGEASAGFDGLDTATGTTTGAMDVFKGTLGGLGVGTAVGLVKDLANEMYELNIAYQNTTADIITATAVSVEEAEALQNSAIQGANATTSKESLVDASTFLQTAYGLEADQAMTLGTIMAENEAKTGTTIEQQVRLAEEVKNTTGSEEAAIDVLQRLVLIQSNSNLGIGDALSLYQRNKVALDDNGVSMGEYIGYLMESSVGQKEATEKSKDLLDAMNNQDKTFEEVNNSTEKYAGQVGGLEKAMNENLVEVARVNEESQRTDGIMDKLSRVWDNVTVNIKANNEAVQRTDGLMAKHADNMEKEYQKELEQTAKDMEEIARTAGAASKAVDNLDSSMDNLDATNLNNAAGGAGAGANSNNTSSFTYNNYFNNVSPTSNNLRNIYLGQKGVN